MLKSFFSENKIEAGCDEVGRGCLAGPVVAAAVILPKDYTHEILNDSKKISPKKRAQLAEEIKKDAIAWAIAESTVEEIDQINILNASYLAMQRSIDKLDKIPELLLIDGNRYKPHNEIPYKCIVKGDSKFLSIAAASILAKTYRDELMENLAVEHSGYGWEKNAGYPTKQHREGIEKFGITDWHRKTFKLFKDKTLFD
ncbi:ribonuclease HII [Aureibacter tunicatorum]|uniref:Ribonuclease HII n=1 Tax=Aureibacter tunicatorum TaxID=866807 RepID=A0AAE3XNG0_9BACT|nr:ribonuclease HII [Aureibacter tunicatorum]MDR6238966.1 ribonuclease HII [Aureibacter tunicatorum]BDD05108.1 ribonuclease HII [Aureibacter tunicatorum]